MPHKNEGKSTFTVWIKVAAYYFLIYGKFMTKKTLWRNVAYWKINIVRLRLYKTNCKNHKSYVTIVAMVTMTVHYGRYVGY